MTKQPRVFVVQQPAKMNRDGEWKPIFDIRPARMFGQLVFVTLRPGNIYLDTLPTILNHMQSVLADFNDDDYILPTGEPVAIAAASMCAAQANNGRVKLLKWDRRGKNYQTVQINLKRK
jgi:hypothetical protein